ncbi:MAG: methylated-DNA--[protein]-cysteine S-methyltransferase [Candidatus Bathyarchaeia archaeon]
MINLYAKEVDGVWFGIACDEEKIFATSFAFEKKHALHSLLHSIPYNVPFQHMEKPSTFANRLLSLLKDVYEGKNVSYDFPLATEHLSNYARKVIAVVSKIPVGFASSYGLVARAAGGSPRAVGRVMATNPFAPIVPCHRVVSADLGLGGYGGGLKAKLDFLRRERRGFSSEREIQVNGGKLRVFPVEFVLRKVEKGKC